MRNECCDCDRPALRFWGRFAYCRQCFDLAKNEAPKAHSCPDCGEEQPPNVLWRGHTCGECRRAEKHGRGHIQ